MKYCRQCLTPRGPGHAICPVCGIDPARTLRELSPREKRIRFHAYGIRLAALLHLTGAGIVVLMLPYFPSAAPLILLMIINLILAFGLARYAFPAYKAATVYYFLLGMVNVISIQHGSVHLGGIALALVALYLIGNRTARSIFDRTVADG